MTVLGTKNKGIADVTKAKRGVGWWVKRGLVGLFAVIIGLPALGVVYEAVMAAGDVQRYPPPGQMVNVNGHNMHLNCTGEGSPTVILESEFAGWSLDWVLAQPEIAKFARVCSYDRAGYGWSESSPDSRSPRQIARELHTLLVNAGVEPPYVLVGHSLGGKYVRMFAELYPDEVAGMVLVDARHESREPQRTPEEDARDAEAYRSSLGLYTLLGRTGVARAFGASLIVGLNPVAQYLPAETRELMAISAGRKRTVDTMIAESADSTDDDAMLRTAILPEGLPLAVLVAGTSIEADPRWLDAQEAMAALSSNSRLVIVESASHTIQWDQPGAVVRGILSIIQ